MPLRGLQPKPIANIAYIAKPLKKIPAGAAGNLRNFLVAGQTLRNRVCLGECALAVDFQARQFRTTVPAEGLLRSNAS